MSKIKWVNEKNHKDITDNVPDIGKRPSGFGGYGLEIQGLLYLLHLPFNFYHQLVCKNNAWCKFKSDEIYKKYTPTKDWYSMYLQECKQQAQQMITQRIERLGV